MTHETQHNVNQHSKPTDPDSSRSRLGEDGKRFWTHSKVLSAIYTRQKVQNKTETIRYVHGYSESWVGVRIYLLSLAALCVSSALLFPRALWVQSVGLSPSNAITQVSPKLLGLRSSPTPSLKCERTMHCFILARMLFQPGCAMEMVPSTHGSGDHSITCAQVVEWKSFHHGWFFTSLVTYLYVKTQRNSIHLFYITQLFIFHLPLVIDLFAFDADLALTLWFSLSIFSQTKHLQLH